MKATPHKAKATCGPPVFILKAGDQRIPIWPVASKIDKTARPVFCPKEHRSILVEKFRVHFHQHPSIPLNDEKGTLLTAREIYAGAVHDIYQYCFTHDLSQTWAYLWNRWYTPAQWALWARSAAEGISRLKTTMVVENLWKHMKSRDLAQFNRPRLDLVTHLVITGVLPRVQLTLDAILDRKRIGRGKALAPWQVDFKQQWQDMSLSNTERLIKKQLAVQKGDLKGKKRDEKLEQIAQDEARERGTYYTDLQRWTCSCHSYLISRFLLCKHLVRGVNTLLGNNPLTKLSFFAGLSRARHAPFYSIPRIHEPEDLEMVDDDDTEGIVLIGGYGSRATTYEGRSSPSLDVSSVEADVRSSTLSTEHLPQNIMVAIDEDQEIDVATKVLAGPFDDDDPESSKRVSEAQVLRCKFKI